MNRTSILVAAGLFLLALPAGIPPAAAVQATIPGMVQVDQIKDSVAPLPGINCSVAAAYCLQNPGTHAPWNAPRDDVPGLDGLYGTPDDCPHCSYYCVPGSIRMISIFYKGLPLASSQDVIYERGKINGEVPGDGVIGTHGVGMRDGGPMNNAPLEVDLAHSAELGNCTRYDLGPPEAPMTPPIVQQAVLAGQPILWCDHPTNVNPQLPYEKGWPTDMYNPPYSTYYEMGHAKVIAGFNDNNTPGNFCDDQYYIDDPWPNAVVTYGANPYWVGALWVFPQNQCSMQDPFDVFYIRLNTVAGCSIACVPASGTLPFNTQFTVILNNNSGYSRREAARIDVTVAAGTFFSNWRSGFTNIAAYSSFITNWVQALPHLAGLHGNNLFRLRVLDVTPNPYNQPPYPPSGDTCTDLQAVTGN